MQLHHNVLSTVVFVVLTECWLSAAALHTVHIKCLSVCERRALQHCRLVCWCSRLSGHRRDHSWITILAHVKRSHSTALKKHNSISYLWIAIRTNPSELKEPADTSTMRVPPPGGDLRFPFELNASQEQLRDFTAQISVLKCHCMSCRGLHAFFSFPTFTRLHFHYQKNRTKEVNIMLLISVVVQWEQQSTHGELVEASSEHFTIHQRERWSSLNYMAR